MRIDHRDGTIFRLLPRRNVEVNRSWLCDEGRLTYHELAAGDRISRPMMRGRDGMQAPVTWKEAVASVNSRLKEIAGTSGGDSIIGFASPSATNEALFLFKRYLGERIGTSQFDFRLAGEDRKVTEKEDDVLRHLDKHPNSMGAMKLGLMSQELGGIDGAIESARAGRIKAGVIIYYKPLVVRPENAQAEARIAELISALDYSVVLAAHKAAWQREASALLPVTAWSEESGTYTNYQGRVQLAAKAIEPGGDILPLWEVLASLLYESGDSVLWLSPDDVFASMAENIPAYRGIVMEQTRMPGALPTA